MITEKTLNNIVIKPLVNTNNLDESKIKGGKYIPEVTPVVYICSRRKSGKTSVFAEINRKTTDKKTTFWLFVPTARVDPSWVQIIQILRDRGNTVNVFDSFMEGKTNILDEIITDLSSPEVEEDKPSVTMTLQSVGTIHPKIVYPGSDEKEKRKYEYKPKKEAPLHCFCVDDNAGELKNTALLSLCKKNRHLKCSVYISSQYCNDLLPQTLKQVSFTILFRSHTREKLEHIHKMLDLSIDLEKFFDIYDYATSEAFNFLFIDMKNQTFRKNFSKELTFDG
jgi:hypothetical protein